MSIRPARPQFAPFVGRLGRSLAGLIAGGTLLAGCTTSPDAAEPATAASGPAEPAAAAAISDREWVARNYLTTPVDARRLGYRIDWQHRGDPTTTMREVRSNGDAVFALDETLRISRYDGSDGTRLWRVPMLESVSRTQGMTYLPSDDQLYVAVGTEFHVYDGGTGVLLDRQRLQTATSTRPLPAGRFLVYGSRDGQVVWHAFQVGAPWRSYRIANTIEVTPAISEGYLVAPGQGGTVSCLRLRDASRVWTKRTLADVVAPPAAGAGHAFVASLDRHLRAWPLAFDTPTPAWEYLTRAPLEDGPTVVGESVYQQVPGHGLHRFAAAPMNRPQGLLEWVAADVTGSVAARLGDRLLTWDAERSLMQVVDERTGDLIESVELPRVSSLHVSDVEGGDLYLGGTGGRVLRLVPSTG